MYFPDGETLKQPRHGRKSPKRKTLWVALGAAAAVVLGASAFGLYSTGALSSILHPVDDYEGISGKTVEFTIAQGDIGETVAKNLANAGIVKSFEAIYKLMLKTDPAPVLIPGVYTLHEHMSAKDALAALSDEKNRLVNQVTITEGTILPKVISQLSAATKIPVAQFESAIKDPQALGLPAQAKTVEGYLFPATYSFSPNQSATDIIEQMIARTFTALDKAKVAPADQFKVITLASLIQKEAGSVKDMSKVSRVFTNRMNEDLWPSGLLESDATVAYGSGHTNRWETTVAERADRSNIYNTYVHPGPLAAPISNPGEDAINAALNPEAGKWLFFVAINLETGETIFSETADQHNAAVVKMQEWWQAHPDYE